MYVLIIQYLRLFQCGISFVILWRSLKLYNYNSYGFVILRFQPQPYGHPYTYPKFDFLWWLGSCTWISLLTTRKFTGTCGVTIRITGYECKFHSKMKFILGLTCQLWFGVRARVLGVLNVFFWLRCHLSFFPITTWKLLKGAHHNSSHCIWKGNNFVIPFFRFVHLQMQCLPIYLDIIFKYVLTICYGHLLSDYGA